MSDAGERPLILLLSSNLRRRYSEDILTALALPREAVIQFRYGADYVAPPLQQKVANGSAIGQRVLLGFVADYDSATNAFLLPVRFATVAEAECVADMFIFKLRVNDYANLDEYPASFAEISEASRRTIGKLKESNSRYYPAVLKFPDLNVSGRGEPAQLWQAVASRLAQHPTFHASYFMRIDDPVHPTRGRSYTFDRQGRLNLSDLKPAKLPVSFYSEVYTESTNITLTCATDGRFLRVSSDDKHDVALRYDSTEFWLQPNAASYDALTHATIRLGPLEASSTPAVTVRFPVVVKHSRLRLASRVLVSSGGAILVAAPAILGGGSSLALRITLAVIGSALISIATVVMARNTT
ncbi:MULTISPECIES: hypothetical protein [Streptacidiphilus]|uniref:Uncharacterized protein n=1 Tax=Streptacidiphilus cavernicola TaxID=3342716 RepID=A0ABV6URP8_9ACTN|nr:hypothetical protein [Streptacidiphilus jeojiense]